MLPRSGVTPDLWGEDLGFVLRGRMTLRPLLRRPGVIALAILLLLAAGMALFWGMARGRVLDTLAVEADALRAQGWQIAYRVGDTGGFPLAVETELTEVQILRPGPRGDLAWRGDRVTLTWSPLRPNSTSVGLPQDSTLKLATPHGPLTGRLRLEDGEIRLTGPRTGGRLTVTLAQPLLTLETPHPIILRAERFALDLQDLGARGRDHLVATVQGSLTLERFTAPQVTPLLAEPLTASVGLTVMGDAPAAVTGSAFADWRDAGGTVEIRPLSLALGGFALEGEGTLTLDRLMRPLAAGTAKVRGFVEGIDRLIAVGLVTERDGRLARLLLSAVATTDPQTGQPSLSVPVTVQDGWLLLGPSRLVPVPPLPLPDPA